MAARSLSHLAVHLGVTLGLAAATVTAIGVATNVGAAGAASSFVPITPCRLMDTRPAPDNVGARSTSIGAGQTYDALVWGTNGNCTIPTTATAVSMNVTAINPTASSFLTVYPSDAAKPLAASLNWVARQAPTPNAVTTTLSAAGRVSFFNLSGNVDLTADIVGYYQPADLPVPGPQGPAGPTGAAGATGPTGAAGPAGGANRLTPAQIGMKRWDQDPGRRGKVSIGANPTDLAFDGSSVWVTQLFAHAVARIDPASSTITATVDFGSGTPNAITWAAGRIWVVTSSPNALLRINPALNAVTATIPLGSAAPNDVTYDGTRLLVANSNGTVTRVNPTTNTVIDSFQIPGAGNLTSIIWDGTSAWAADLTLSAVHRLDTSTPARVGTQISVGSVPSDLAFDGTSVWVSSRAGGTVKRIDPNAPGLPNSGAGDVTGTISGIPQAGSIAYDGTFLRVTGDGAVHRLNTTSMSVTATWTVGAFVIDVLYDGSNLWVADPTSAAVFKGVLF